jgi:hypothetical protein
MRVIVRRWPGSSASYSFSRCIRPLPKSPAELRFAGCAICRVCECRLYTIKAEDQIRDPGELSSTTMPKALIRECLELILMLADALERKKAGPAMQNSHPVTPQVAP